MYTFVWYLHWKISLNLLFNCAAINWPFFIISLHSTWLHLPTANWRTVHFSVLYWLHFTVQHNKPRCLGQWSKNSVLLWLSCLAVCMDRQIYGRANMDTSGRCQCNAIQCITIKDINEMCTVHCLLATALYCTASRCWMKDQCTVCFIALHCQRRARRGQTNDNLCNILHSTRYQHCNTEQYSAESIK